MIVHRCFAVVSFVLIGLVNAAASAQIIGIPEPLPPLSDDPTLSPRAAAARHGTFHASTFERFVQHWRQHDAAGMRLVDIDVFEASDGSQQFFGVWKPASGRSALYRYTSKQAFLDRVEIEHRNGYQLIDIEIASIGNRTWYYGVWLGTGQVDPLTESGTWASFLRLHSRLVAAGQRLVDVELSSATGATRYWGVWTAGTRQQQLIRGTSRSAFQQAHDDARKIGLRLIDMSALHKSDDNQEYIGLVEQASGPWAYYLYRRWNDFKRRWAKLAQNGRSLRDLEVIRRPGGGRYYIGTWGRGPVDPVGHTDTEEMAAEIHDRLFGKVVGYSFAIADQSQLAIAGAGGLAQRSPDPQHEMTSVTYSTVASVTKHLTGVALLALLERNGIDPQTSVAEFLPATWNPDPSVQSLTFEHLLTHTSGLKQLLSSTTVTGTGNDWSGLQTTMEQVGAAPGSSRSYKNANFALQRVLIPALRRELEGGSIPVVTEDNVRELYLDALDDIVLERLAIDDVSCETPEGLIQALSYEKDNTSKPGKSWGTTGSGCGGHANLQLNAQQLALFLTGVRYSNRILSADGRDYMDSERAGWHSSLSVDGGTAYSHDGDYFSSKRETHTCVIRLPNGIDAAIVINSLTPTAECTVLRLAYNAATP